MTLSNDGMHFGTAYTNPTCDKEYMMATFVATGVRDDQGNDMVASIHLDTSGSKEVCTSIDLTKVEVVELITALTNIYQSLED